MCLANDVGPSAPFGEFVSKPIAVVGAVRQQDLTSADVAQHVGGAATVMRLPLRQLQGDRQAISVHEGVDLRGQPAPRAPHASGVSDVASGGTFLDAPLLTLEACWCTRIEELSTICRSPS